MMHALDDAIDAPWFDHVMGCFTHVDWEGFSSWDLVMPLFMFMSGITIPFALARYKREGSKGMAYRRIIKRVVLLWLFGMICQGNLLGLDPDRIYLYSNTLQAIAAGYLIAALLYLNTSVKTQIATSVVLLLAFWGCMEWIQVDGYGGGCYTAERNLAEWIDRIVLGRFRDGATVNDGTVVFASWYHYTWVLSTMTFGVTTLTGTFAGHILKSDNIDVKHKFYYLLATGLSLVAIGWLWGLQMPVIKKLWTSSMVLVSSGYCFVLMALFYWGIDYKGYNKHTTWLKVYGMNSITAYLLTMCINFTSVSSSLLYGMRQYVGDYYPALIALGNAAIVYLILWLMYRRQVFLKI
jgi:predicted acyltransferase